MTDEIMRNEHGEAICICCPDYTCAIHTPANWSWLEWKPFGTETVYRLVIHSDGPADLRGTCPQLPATTVYGESEAELFENFQGAVLDDAIPDAES